MKMTLKRMDKEEGGGKSHKTFISKSLDSGFMSGLEAESK